MAGSVVRALYYFVRTLLPQEDSEGGKDECEIEEGRQETDNRKCFKAGEIVRQRGSAIASSSYYSQVLSLISGWWVVVVNNLTFIWPAMKQSNILPHKSASFLSII